MLNGRYCRLEALHPARHAADLRAANALDADGSGWTYLSYGPLVTPEDYHDWMRKACAGDDPLFYAIVNLADEKAVGVASYMRIDPASGCIEVGGIKYSPLLQRTRAATEGVGRAIGWRRRHGSGAVGMPSSHHEPRALRPPASHARPRAGKSTWSGRCCRPTAGGASCAATARCGTTTG